MIDNTQEPGLLRWEQGRAAIDAMLREGSLTRVHASHELAGQYVQNARKRLQSVELIKDMDPVAAFVLAYDAARLGLAAILINQGLRPRGEGAHALLLEAVLAQTEPPRQRVFREFSWMRKLRNETQYPDADSPSASADDLAQAIPAATAIIDRAEVLIAHMPPY